MDTIHSCSWYCDRPECAKRQRDEFRETWVQMNEKHMAEIATLESEIKMVRARNERLEREVKEMESLAYGNMGGKGCMK